eukprot:gb/GFBE01071926.1/.p1 GENE.gb/GFBE01071926.1/~~gb/GFBE01071926.1/.p1  ORF type:complete len:309 (+),score=64.57 gb/GFBE01071926.1/:1-927(+)
MAFSECLRQYKVKDLPLSAHLVTLHHPRDGLFSAIHTLCEHHLLSAPVVDESGKLLGLLDTLDIVAHVVEAEAAGQRQLRDQSIHNLMGKGSRRAGGSVPTASLEDALHEVVDIVAGPARRVVVMDAEGRPCSIITQSTVIQFLHEKKDEMKEFMHSRPAKEFCTHGAITISDQETALHAFELLASKGVSSVAIVDQEGRAITVVSATDLVMGLGLMGDMSMALSQLRTRNIVFFVGDSRRPDHHMSHTRAAIIAVDPEMPMDQVIEKFAKTRVHRMIVTAGDRKPIGVLSLSDVCKSLSPRGSMGGA